MNCSECNAPVTSDARYIVDRAYDGLDPKSLIDYHVHLIGTNQQQNGNHVHRHFLSWKHPFLHGLFLLFQKAFGIQNIKNADNEALDRLIQLTRTMKGTYYLLAFDGNYNNPEKTRFVVSNEYVSRVAHKHHDLFRPTASIHPYRPDALHELEKRASLGVRIIKWLPNVMGMDPSDPRCIPFYKKMHTLNLVLLTHAGHESLIPLTVDQELGNPLRLRPALDEGVTVIMAHSATSGKSMDLGHKWNNFDLFLRLMQEPRSKGLLFGDLAGVTLINRMRYLNRLIEEAQPGGILEGRLVNGSDYPIPCCNWAISTRLLKLFGYITVSEQKALNEIFHFNPLLFDFVLKRTIKHTKTRALFPKEIFTKTIG